MNNTARDNACGPDHALTQAASSLVFAAQALEKTGNKQTAIIKSTTPRRGLSRSESAEYIGVSQNIFMKMVKSGLMPKPIRALSRVIWDIRALDSAFTAMADPQYDNPWD